MAIPLSFHRITKPYFRTCSTRQSRSQAPFCLYALRAISVRAEGTFGRLRCGHGIVHAALNNSQVVALSADLADSVGFGEFAEKIGASRFIEVGVAEQNLVTVAAGLAAMGNIPFAASYAAFSPGRNWEQIRTTICLNNQPVKLVGSHAEIGRAHV